MASRRLMPWRSACNVIQPVTGAAVAAACFRRLSEEAGHAAIVKRKLKAICEEHDYQALRRCLEVDFNDMSSDYRPII